MDRRNGHVSKSVAVSRGGDDGIVQASKAIYDQVKALLTQHKADVDERFKQLETTLHVQFGKALEVEFRKMLDGEFDKRLPVCVLEFRGQVEGLRNSYQFGLEQVQELLRSLPTPNVNVSVPEQVVNVNVPENRPIFNVPEQSAPVVNVNVPESVINVNPTPFNFHVPEQKQPDVHVNLPEYKPIFQLPEQKPADVHVHVPEQQAIFNVPKQDAPVINVTSPKQEASIVNVSIPRRKTKKTFVYDEATGRPTEVVEEDVTETETK